MNKAVLLQLQQVKAKAARELEMRNNMRHIYDNLSFEDSEIKQDPTKDSSSPSQIEENQKQEKEERIDSF